MNRIEKQRQLLSRSIARAAMTTAFAVGLLAPGFCLPQAMASTQLGGSAQAPSYIPDWSARAELFEGQNASYLSNNLIGTDRDQYRSVPQFLQEQQIRDLKIDHDKLVRDYELKAQYGLLSPDEERAHYDAVQSFSKSLAVRIGRNQIQDPLDRLRNFVEKDSFLSFAQRPVALIALAMAVYNGQPLLMGLGQDSSLKARANVPASEAEVIVKSPVLDSSVYLKANAQTADELAAQQLKDPLARDERMRVSAGRSLGFFGIYSGLTYGNTTQTFTASLSKQLVSNLNASVNSRRPLSPNQNGGENSLNFNYGLSF